MYGQNLKTLRESRNMGVNELSRLSNVNASYISAIENGKKKNPSMEILQKLASALNVSLNELLSVKSSEIDLREAIPVTKDDMVNLPIVGIIRAGQPILVAESIEGYFPTPKNALCASKEYFYLKVKGDSMNLKFQEGSLLLIEKTNCIENGEIGVVLINGSDATVKKVVTNENTITLIPMSSNLDHIPTMYDIVKDDVKIIGKAKMAINFL